MVLEEEVTSGSRLGFIGLGYLGSRIARRLAAAGFPMVVYNRDRAKTAAIQAAGAEVAADAAELAAGVDVVLTCLTDGSAVQDVYLGSGGVIQSVRPGARIIELSTISPETSRRLHQAAQKRGICMLDVAVSGSTTAADAGALTLFGGGERRTFEGSRPIFAAIAKQWFYMGAGGSGVAMKLAVNTLLGLGMQALAEAVALGSGLNLPRDLLLDTLARTAVVPPALVAKLASARNDDYTPQFPVRLMRKDFGLIMAAAARLDLTLPATEAAAAVNFAEDGRDREEDFSAVIRRMEEQAVTDRSMGI